MATARGASGATFQRFLEDLISAKVRRFQAGRRSRGDEERLYRVHKWAIGRIEALGGEGPDTRGTTGLSDQAVALAAYDAGWPAEFDTLAAEIRRILGPGIRAIHHIGSTAVPELSAKPIVDCAVLVPAEALSTGFDLVQHSMEEGGFTHRGQFGGGIYFSREKQGVRVASAQIHAEGSADVARLLQFRDRLRTDDAFRNDYRRVKRSLTAAFPRNRGLYFWFKGHWIRESLLSESSAKAWSDWFFESEHPSMLNLALRFGRGAKRKPRPSRQTDRR